MGYFMGNCCMDNQGSNLETLAVYGAPGTIRTCDRLVRSYHLKF